MKFGSIYDQALSISKESEEISKTLSAETSSSPAEDAAHTQTRINWLASTPTEFLVKKLSKQVNDLLSQSIMQAITFPSHNNYQQIIQNLVRVSELQKTIEDITKL